MKTTLTSIAFILLAAAIALVLIFNNDKSDFRIVKFSGVTEISKMDISVYNVFTLENESGISALPLYEDELITIFIDNMEFYYKYQFDDGVDLSFRAEGFKVFLNDRLIHIEIDDDDDFLTWFESVEAGDVKDLKSIYIEDSLTDRIIEPLNRLAEFVPKLGIIDEGNYPDLEYFLSTFDPIWIGGYYEPESGSESIERLLEDSKNLELLFVSWEFFKSVDIAGLDQLKQLIIYVLEDAGKLNEIMFPKNLEYLAIMHSELADLDFLSGMKKLKRLSLSIYESLAITPNTDSFKNLNSLSLSGTGEALGFELIAEMPSLKKIGFPAEISQDNFNRLLSLNDQLEIVEMVACENITNIDALANLPDLRCLTVIESEIPFETYSSLKGLKYLSLTYDPEDDKASIDSLQSQMPNTLIVPSSGLCLGSGWLLAFLPLIFMLWIILVIKKRRLKYLKVFFR